MVIRLLGFANSEALPAFRITSGLENTGRVGAMRYGKQGILLTARKRDLRKWRYWKAISDSYAKLVEYRRYQRCDLKREVTLRFRRRASFKGGSDINPSL